MVSTWFRWLEEILKCFGIGVEQYSISLEWMFWFGKIDKKESKDFYFYYSKHLKEQPINLIIKKELLICLSVFYGEIKKNIKDKVYHIDFYINDKEKKSG